ncbi:hypothetical protein [Hymenobacter lucidus]|uniref:Peptidylprolyl isomerase n=1 Tax=Hymenobacter lucidus TaxID=2880930 RepID=A0ABS8AQD6_9BACT|nr:hypothetical protein [Hymenobacter lucidus]MCB2408425.1 hypothetical protein [Hymenobacter lucidus]
MRNILSAGIAVLTTLLCCCESKELPAVKTVVLIDNNEFRVTTDYKVLDRNFTKWVENHPNLEDDSMLLSSIRSQNTESIIYANKLADSLRLNQRLEFRIADLLELDSCLILSKSGKEYVATAKSERVSDTGTSGRKFSVEGRTILVVIDNIY